MREYVQCLIKGCLILKNSSLGIFKKAESSRYFRTKLKKIVQRHMSLDTEYDDLAFWQNKVFSYVVIGLIYVLGPLMIFGAYMFYQDGDILPAISELVIFLAICLIVATKNVTLAQRKFLVLIVIYSLGIFLLIETGPKGAGLESMLFALALGACLLTVRKTIYLFVGNLLVVATITFLLMSGFFVDTALELYRGVWLINIASVQGAALVLMIVIRVIVNGVEEHSQSAKISQEQLRLSQEKYQAMIANISDVVTIADAQGHLIYASPNMVARFGWSAEDFAEASVLDRIYEEDRQRALGAYSSILRHPDAEITLELRLVSINNNIGHFEITAVNKIEDSNIKGVLITVHDITDRKLREEKLEYLHYHDALTGLYNRQYLDAHLMQMSAGDNLPLSIISADINGLKIINTAFGEKSGDAHIVNAVGIISSCCRCSDVIFRIAGDDILIILPSTSGTKACEIVDAIYDKCEEYNRTQSNGVLHLSLAMGVATQLDSQTSIESVIKESENHVMSRKLLETRSHYSSMLSSMLVTLAERSQETEEHASRLAAMSKKIGKVLGLSRQEFDELELLAKLHDIGKIGIDDAVLNKPGPLAPDEWKLMCTHPEIGYRIAKASPEFLPIAEYILMHHERWDGSGYPQGLKGNDIYLLSRIIAVVDSYDAMTHDRIYKKGMDPECARREIERCSGTQYDPEIVEIFLKILSE